jgi:hypothetical protein
MDYLLRRAIGNEWSQPRKAMWAENSKTIGLGLHTFESSRHTTT